MVKRLSTVISTYIAIKDLYSCVSMLIVVNNQLISGWLSTKLLFIEKFLLSCLVSCVSVVVQIISVGQRPMVLKSRPLLVV